eukprot:1155395-Pelagomonas_calceolata.AAC.1
MNQALNALHDQEQRIQHEIEAAVRVLTRSLSSSHSCGCKVVKVSLQGCQGQGCQGLIPVVASCFSVGPQSDLQQGGRIKPLEHSYFVLACKLNLRAARVAGGCFWS